MNLSYPSTQGRRAAFLGLVLALASWPVAAAEYLARDIEASGYAGGFHVGDATGSIELEGDAYRMRFSAKGAGLAKLLLRWRYELEAEGRTTAETSVGLTPSIYRSKRFRLEKTNIRVIQFTDGVPVAQTESKGKNEETSSPLPIEMRRGAIDPASAILAVGLAIARGGTCNLAIPIFDGKRRNDMIVIDRGLVTLEPSRRNPFGGLTRHCSFVFKRIAGYSEKDMRKTPFTGDVWFLENEDNLLRLPVKFQTRLRTGAFILHIRPQEKSIKEGT